MDNEPQPTMPSPNIYQRLNKVRESVPFVAKDEKLISGKYKAVTHDAVTGLIREHLIKHGVMIVPSLVSSRVANSGITTGKGIPYIRYEATYCVKFVNCDDPQDFVEMHIESHALDEGDKAPGKAMSYAVKYAMLKLFSIETGEEEERRIHDGMPTAPITPRGGCWDNISVDMANYIRDELAPPVVVLHARGDLKGMFAEYQEAKTKLDAEQQIALWDCFESEVRTAITKYGNSLKQEEAA